jgi:acyl-CoA thioester hydrolase
MPELINLTKTLVRFSEIDALGIVWHGHYVKFMEDGREAFGKEFGLAYLDVYRQSFATPLVNINVDFRKTVKYGDSVSIQTKYVDSPAAKIIFEYIITRDSDGEVVASGQTTQVFMSLNYELHITIPEFFRSWKEQHGLLTPAVQ